MLACTSPPSPTAARPPPSCCGRATARRARARTGPLPISPPGPRRKWTGCAACCATSPSRPSTSSSRSWPPRTTATCRRSGWRCSAWASAPLSRRAAAAEDDLYDAMDWLLARQERIEQKLAARHLQAGGLVLYDLTSSYFEGTTCPLAALGHNRDGKKGKLQVNYGLLTARRGCPVAVSVFKGNTGDPKTLLPQVTRVRERFGIEALVLVGDRGMISQTQIDALRQQEEGIDWITAL